MKLRLKKSVKKVLQVLLIVVLILLCLLFLKSRVTYTSYESNVEGKVASPIASWRISIDGKDITTSESSTGIKIDNVTWNTSNVREGKVAPGSTGDMAIEIDPTGTDVAIYYELEVIDKTVDEDKILKVTSILSDKVALTKVAVNKYVGVLSLDDIESGVKPVISVKVIWESNEEVVYDPDAVNDLDSFLVFNFTAKQYNGETLPAEYTE